MKQYPHELLAFKERIFNYRLSRARKVVENVFCILAAQFSNIPSFYYCKGRKYCECY